MKNRHIILPLIFLAFLSGCAVVGPDYSPPIAPVMESFSMEGPMKTSKGADVTEWWRKLNDPSLDALIEHAAANNNDIRIAYARIMEARANRGVARAERFPVISARSSAKGLRLSETGLETANMPESSAAGYDPTQGLTDAGFDASWEIDLFGRVKREIEAADAVIETSEADLEDAMVTLLSELARNYVTLRKTQSQIAIIKQNLDLQQKSLELTLKRFEQGVDTQLNITRTEALIADTEARIPVLRTQEKLLTHRLAALLGETPGFLKTLLDDKPEIPVFPEEIVIGIPADLLRNRPDIRAAERNLAARTAQIGIAEADLYPRLRLNGSIGLSTVDLEDASLTKSITGSIGPSFSWSLFDGGFIRSRIAAADARSKAALAIYDKTVIRSYEEVENALVEHSEELRRREHLKKAVAANIKAYDLSMRLYSSGLADYLNVLDSHRGLLQTKEMLEESNAIVTNSIISLYKAFGGGMAMKETKLPMQIKQP